MNYFIVVILISIPLGYSDPIQVAKLTGKMAETVAKCSNETNADANALQNYLNFELEKNHNNKCFRYCLLKRTGMLNDQERFIHIKLERAFKKYVKTSNNTETFQEFVSNCEHLKLYSDK